jgi:hypothetical protein
VAGWSSVLFEIRAFLYSGAFLPCVFVYNSVDAG